MRVRYAVNAMHQDKRKQQPIGYTIEPMACSLLDAMHSCPFKDNVAVPHRAAEGSHGPNVRLTHDVHHIVQRDMSLRAPCLSRSVHFQSPNEDVS
jgi:hypothetical protein